MKLFDETQYINQLSIDCVIFGYQDLKIKVLISKVNFDFPVYTLPGGFIKQEESIDQAAQRILFERTGLQDLYLEQFKVFGDSGRYNREIAENIKKISIEKEDESIFGKTAIEWFAKRFITIGYYALVDISKVQIKRGVFDESVGWYSIKEIPQMIMDHNLIVGHALEVLRLNFDQKLIGFNLLPETFTMKEVQSLYEAVYDKPFARNNFQKKILDLNVLERMEKKFTGAANKAPYLYKFKKSE